MTSLYRATSDGLRFLTIAAGLSLPVFAITASAASDPASSNGAIKQAARSTSKPDAKTDGSSQQIKPAIAVDNQVIKARQVLFTRVQAPQSAWLVLHPSDAMGQMDSNKTIGRAHVTPGVHNNVIVHLNAPVAAGHRIYAMLHKDTGDADSYEFHQSNGRVDPPLIVNGHHVMASFDVLKSAKKTAHNKPRATAKPGQAGPSNMQGNDDESASSSQNASGKN